MRSTLFVAFAALLIVAMLAGVGCTDDSPIAPKNGSEPGPYAPLTDPEHVIQNLIQSYKDRDAERFRELLKDPEYRFYLQDRDVRPGDEKFLTLEEDYDVTKRMFLSAMGTPEGSDPKIDWLELHIWGGSTWSPIDSIGDEACTGCLYTERIYDITVIIGDTSYLGSDIVGLYVQPVDDGGVIKYKIRRVYDLPK